MHQRSIFNKEDVYNTTSKLHWKHRSIKRFCEGGEGGQLEKLRERILKENR